MQDNVNSKNKALQDDARKLVMERIRASSKDMMISVGGDENLSRRQLLESVEKGDELGQRIVNIQLAYLRDLAEGKIYQDLYNDESFFDNETKF